MQFKIKLLQASHISRDLEVHNKLLTEVRLHLYLCVASLVDLVF